VERQRPPRSRPNSPLDWRRQRGTPSTRRLVCRVRARESARPLVHVELVARAILLGPDRFEAPNAVVAGRTPPRSHRMLSARIPRPRRRAVVYRTCTGSSGDYAPIRAAAVSRGTDWSTVEWCSVCVVVCVPRRIAGIPAAVSAPLAKRGEIARCVGKPPTAPEINCMLRYRIVGWALGRPCSRTERYASSNSQTPSTE
jgi:hypothetical protein